MPASTPLAWPELYLLEHPRELNYASVPERLSADFDDPWAEIDRAARALPKLGAARGTPRGR